MDRKADEWMKDNNLLEVNQLEIGILSGKKKKGIVNRISFGIKTGEIIGIVGESGSGKSMTALSILGLLPEGIKILNGSIQFEGKEITNFTKKQLRTLRGKNIGMIFQEPMTSLNPLVKVGIQVEEMLLNHTKLNKEERKNAILSKFEEVGLEDCEKIYEKYPHQLSGGMRQRVMIAMAMICNPKLLIADEPTTALDVTVQSQILELIKKLNKEYGTSVILISHDLGVISSICNRALVVRQGRIIEEGLVTEIFQNPKEEYTKNLLRSVPGIHNRIGNIKMNTNQELSHRKESILRIEGLDAFYEEKQEKSWKRGKKKVLENISLEVYKGEIYGIVGESGSGKSTLAKVIAGIHKDINGSIILKETRPMMVFQDSYGSLNPAKKISWILEEPLKICGGYSKRDRLHIVSDMLEQVGLEEEYKNRYLNELSGGQRQRVGIAASLMLQSEFIILDEPVSALDVTVQAQILNLLMHLREKYNLTLLFISHDLNVIRQICDRVCVLHEGKIVETALVEELYQNPSHEYSKILIDSIPIWDN